MGKRALITGICGQDGSYLTELLIRKGYEVHGLMRRSSSVSTWRIDHLKPVITLHEGDMLDAGSLVDVVEKANPDEIYNLAAQSFVPASFAAPDYTSGVNAAGTVRLLEAVRRVKKGTRFYQASTSEMFGSTPPPQSETTRFHPRSPYGVAKLAAHYSVVNNREAYGLFAANGILFNHESPRRGEMFVTRKISRAAARIKLGLETTLKLGNLDARRDWGYAPEYVEAMWRMLQAERPDDYVIATGHTHTIREFVEIAFSYLDLDWQRYVAIDPAFYRATEVDALCGDPSKANRDLGWAPTMQFSELVKLMVDADLNRETRR